MRIIKDEEVRLSIPNEITKTGRRPKRLGTRRRPATQPGTLVFRVKKSMLRQARLARFAAIKYWATERSNKFLNVLGAPMASKRFAAVHLKFDNTRTQRERQLFSFLLDQEKPVSELTVAKLIHQRLSVDIVDRMIAEGVRQQEIYALVAPRRTLTHRRSKQEPLTVDESDRAARLARVIALAESVFGDKEKAMNWLRRDAKQFDGQAPMAMLETDAGSRLVEESLIQIDEGYFA